MRKIEMVREDRMEVERERDKYEQQMNKEAERVQKLQHELSTTRRQLDQAR